MRTQRRFAVIVAVLVALTSRATADDVLHIKTPSHVATDGGTDLRLPPGYFLDEPAWKTHNDETKRLQDAETRLAAENKSLRKSAADISFGWYALSAALVAGFAAGYLLAN